MSGNGSGAGSERLLGQPEHDRAVLADGVEHHRVLELGDGFAQDVDALGLERTKMREPAFFSVQRRRSFRAPRGYAPRASRASPPRAQCSGRRLARQRGGSAARRGAIVTEKAPLPAGARGGSLRPDALPSRRLLAAASPFRMQRQRSPGGRSQDRGVGGLRSGRSRRRVQRRRRRGAGHHQPP